MLDQDAKIIHEQVELLANWNKKIINDAPVDYAEQARKNIETIITALASI